MGALSGLFLNNLLPIFLASAAGYPLGKWLKVPPKPLSQVIFYVFSPCLVFTLLTDNHLNGGEVLRMSTFTIITTLAIGLVAAIAGRAFRLDKRLLIAVLITSMFQNAGNYGLPVNLFAFGEDALAQATIFFVTNAILTTVVGAFLASMGSVGIKESLLELLRLPILYALALAFIFSFTGWEMPLFLDRTVRLLSDAALPSMMVLLGLQLQGANWKGQSLPLILASSVRLLVAPLLAMGFTLLFGLQGPARQAGILEAAMPSAVLCTVLATQYDLCPEFVTSTVFISTLLSPLTLTPLLAYLK